MRNAGEHDAQGSKAETALLGGGSFAFFALSEVDEKTGTGTL